MGLLNVKRRVVLIWRRSYLKVYGDLRQLERYKFRVFYSPTAQQIMLSLQRSPVMPKEIEANLGSDPDLREARGNKLYREFYTMCWFVEDGTQLAVCGHEHRVDDRREIVACGEQKSAEGLAVFLGRVLEERSCLRSTAARLAPWLSRFMNIL